jgi:RecB family exonuclease
MKSGPENAVKKKVKALLDKYGIFHFCVAVSPFGVRGISDRIAILPNGKILAIECKAPGKKPTPLQMQFLDAVAKNNGSAFVVNGELDLAILEKFLYEKQY